LVIFSHELVGMVVSLWEMRHLAVQTTETTFLVVHFVMVNLRPFGTVPVYRR
jgi:hypothetical protein